MRKGPPPPLDSLIPAAGLMLGGGVVAYYVAVSIFGLITNHTDLLASGFFGASLAYGLLFAVPGLALFLVSLRTYRGRRRHSN